MRAAMGADAALTNGGGIRANRIYEPGTIVTGSSAGYDMRAVDDYAGTRIDYIAPTGLGGPGGRRVPQDGGVTTTRESFTMPPRP